MASSVAVNRILTCAGRVRESLFVLFISRGGISEGACVAEIYAEGFFHVFPVIYSKEKCVKCCFTLHTDSLHNAVTSVPNGAQ